MEYVIAALAGLLINGIAYLNRGGRIATKHVVLATAVVIGFGYAAFSWFVPAHVQENIVAFGSVALSTSWVVWEYLIKKSE